MLDDDLEHVARALAATEGDPPEIRIERLREMLGSDPGRMQIALEALAEEAQRGSTFEPPSFSRLVDRSDPTDLVGARLGDYQIEARLGSGGMGIVYRAIQTSLGRDVAIKVLKRSSSRSRFEREAHSARRLEHPGVVEVYGHQRERGVDFIAMEFVDGTNLAKEIEQRRDPDGRPRWLPEHGTAEYARCVADLVAQAADALHHAHGRGVMHRDVKPGNLLLDAQGRVRITDFGLAHDDTMPEITATNDLLGTCEYMSPEQIRRSSDVDARTDVYALGVVLYELLALRRPYRRDGPAVFAEVFDPSVRPLPLPSDRVPRALATICVTAMSRDVVKRYASAAALRDDLQRFLDGKSIRARDPLIDGAVHWMRERRALIVTAVVGGLGAWAASHGAEVRASRRKSNVWIDATGPVPASEQWRAWFERIDRVTGGTYDRRFVGALPIDDDFEPGYCRFTIADERIGRFEYTRHVRTEDEPVVIDFDRDRAAAVGVTSWHDMVRVDGADLAIPPEEGESLCPLKGRVVPVESFWLDRCEVTVAQYRAFLAATSAQQEPRCWRKFDHGLHEQRPVVGISWEEARAYAEWAGKRLPTVPELALAARGATGRSFVDERAPWSGAVQGPRISYANDDVVLAAYAQYTSDVDSMPATVTSHGIRHLHGNVWEWTENLGVDHEAVGLVHRYESRLCFGADWTAQARDYAAGSYTKVGTGRSNARLNVGFRCARSASTL